MSVDAARTAEAAEAAEVAAVEVAAARVAVLEHWRWVGGHADVWRVFRDPAALAAVVRGLVAPYRSAGVTAVAGVESRGFLLGGAAAVELGVGFVAVRKPGAIFPGAKERGPTARNYRGISGELLLQRESVRSGDRILLVDDWAETGSSARAVTAMVGVCGASVVGVSVVIDQLPPDVPRRLPPVHALLAYDDLPPP